MQQNKSKIVMLYPYSGQMLAWQTAFVWGVRIVDNVCADRYDWRLVG